MIIYKNVLSSTLLEELDLDLQTKKRERCWGLGDFVWDENLLVGITGTCASTLVSPVLVEKLKVELDKFLPPHSNLNCSFYMWTRNSGISLHDDDMSHVAFACTLYLNRQWNENHGGLFVYRDSEDGGRVFIPEFNSLVVNNDKTYHLVTPVSPLAPSMRSTIQIWGLK